MRKAELKKLSKDEWRILAEAAHLTCFEESRSSEMDRIDYAMIALDNGAPSAYVTVRELDADSVYWQYGGAFPNAEKGMKAFREYQGFVDWHLEHYKRITTYIENQNLPMLKMAMHCGFRIIGVRLFKGDVLVEMLNEANND